MPTSTQKLAQWKLPMNYTTVMVYNPTHDAGNL